VDDWHDALMPTRISFVVPVRNDAIRLGVCLRSITAARPSAEDAELIVIDNGSSDGSADVARGFGARVAVIEHLPVSELRNRGAGLATADVIAFVDADNEIAPGWIDAALENLRDPHVGATGALYEPPRPGTWVQQGYGLLRGLTRTRAETGWLGSGNLAVSRRAFGAVNGFNGALEACEDVDLCQRLRAAGFALLGDPRLGSVHHGDPRTLGALFRGELWRGRNNLRVSFRRPIDWASVPSALVPVADAVLLGIAAIGLVGWAGSWRGLVLTIGPMFLIALGALGRLLRAARTQPVRTPIALLQGFVVVLVYDLARALALVTRTPHRGARSGVAAVAS
jgi:GT2 family glycosyltransferase